MTQQIWDEDPFKNDDTDSNSSGKLQSAKKILLPPKYEIVMVPSNHSKFQYCDSNIGIFSIDPMILVKLLLLILFSSVLVSVLGFFFDCSHSKVIVLSLFLALKGDSKKITVNFC